jgi:hypothetical protein
MSALKIIYYVIAAYNVYESIMGRESWNLKIQKEVNENNVGLVGLRPEPHQEFW